MTVGTDTTPERTRYHRRIIRIRAEDSPNVQLALREIAMGLEPSHREIVPGVLSYRELLRRRALWDKVRQCIGLEAQFWMGADQLLYPPEWLNFSERLADALEYDGVRRRAESIGCDPAEGGDNTCWAVSDHYGLMDMVTESTPDTSVIPDRTISLMRKFGVPPEMTCFDRGGGGKQVADDLRRRGYNVRTVAFGEPLSPDPHHGRDSIESRMDDKEEKYVYVNRRAQMYGILRELARPIQNRSHVLDMPVPTILRRYNFNSLAIPSRFTELRRQMSLIPLLFDREGRMRMLPKRRKDRNSRERTLTELLGCSPDEADAFAISVYVMNSKVRIQEAGTIGYR